MYRLLRPSRSCRLFGGCRQRGFRRLQSPLRGRFVRSCSRRMSDLTDWPCSARAAGALRFPLPGRPGQTHGTGTSMRTALGLLLLITSTGCAPWGAAGLGGAPACGPRICVERCRYHRPLDDCHTTLSARRCASQALSGWENRDYQRGFTQAFVDVALGRTGEAPPVPPQRYWSVCFRSDCGQGRAADWYAGYREGASLALANCQEVCRTIPTSGAGYHFGPTHGGSGYGEMSHGGDVTRNGTGMEFDSRLSWRAVAG